MLHTLDVAVRFWGYDVELSFRRNYTMAQIGAEALAVPGVMETESWGVTSIRRLRPDDSESDSITMVAPPAATHMLEPTILEGRWLLPEDENALVINTDVRDMEPDLRLGDSIILRINGRKTSWQIVGLARGILAGPAAYANYPYFAQVMRTVGLAGRVQVATSRHDVAYQTQVSQALEARFKEMGIRVGASQTTGQQRERTASQFNILVVFLLIMAMLLAVVGGLGLMGLMSINVLERRREIGVMRAIGASDGAVLRVVMAEGVVIGLFSWLLGTLVALPIGRLMSDSVGMAILKSPLSYAYSFNGALLWLLLAIGLGALASFLPARHASRLTVREVLAYE
jgi:putative ABC transport system permease protein